MTLPKKRSETQRRRPKQERSRVVVDAILTATAQVLAEHGAGRASTNRIARAAGVSVGTLYQYFDCKQSLFEALVDQMLQRMVEAVATPLSRESGASDPAAMERAIESAFVVMKDYRGVLPQLHAADDTAVSRAIRARLLKAKAQAQALLVAWFADAHLELAGNASLTARMLVDMAEGILVNLAPEDNNALIAREFCKMAERYLKVGSRSQS